ncbi:MAG: serine/threonine-protein kinase [Planctomycetota bacterium]
MSSSSGSWLPSHFGRYEVLGELGRGGMGVVVRARNPVLGHEVALKVLVQARAARPDQRTRFLREGRAVARIQHPGVVNVLDAGEVDGTPYLALELVDGGSLAERLDREGPLPPAEVIALADALAAVHAAGVVHRDLKPADRILRPSPSAARARSKVTAASPSPREPATAPAPPR